MSETTENPALAWAFLQFVLFEHTALMADMPEGFYPDMWHISWRAIDRYLKTTVLQGDHLPHALTTLAQMIERELQAVDRMRMQEHVAKSRADAR